MRASGILSSSIACVLASIGALTFGESAYAILSEKRPGAMNPSIDPGDRYEFRCAPETSTVRITERGHVLTAGGQGSQSDKTSPVPLQSPLRSLESASNTQSLVRYVECYVRGKELIATYEKWNGKDASVVATRCPLHPKSVCTWRVEVAVPTMGVPKLNENFLSLSLGILDVDLDLKTGKMRKWRGTGCLHLNRTEAGRTRIQEAIGPNC